jgi:SAM-dependent methyltransferase
MRTLGDVLADLSSDGGEDAHLYSTLAPVYDFVYERHFDYDRQSELVEKVTADLSGDRGENADSVLEIGPGTGHLLAELETRYGTVAGLEYSESMAERARTRTDEAEIVVGDATSTRLDERFDAVVMLGRVTGHFPGDGEAERAVENCLAHLRPGGVLLFDYFPTDRMADRYENTETFESEDYRVTAADATASSDADHDLVDAEFEYEITDRRTGESATTSETMFLRTFTHDEVRELLADAGFAEVAIRPEAADGWPLAVARRPERND